MRRLTMALSRAPIINEVDIKLEVWARWFTDISDLTTPPNRDSGIFGQSNSAIIPFTFFSNLTITGIMLFTNNFVRHGQILFFDVLIKQDPDNPGGTSASTLGTTFFLLPSLLINGGGDSSLAKDLITASGYGFVNGFNVSTPEDFGAGFVEKGNLKAFTPTWAATGDDISVTGNVRIEGL